MKATQKITLLCATVIAALLGTTQAMDGLLPYYTVSKKVLDTDYFDVNVRVKSYNGWKWTTDNDQNKLTSKVDITSETKVRVQFEFFNQYIYQSTTSISPITITPCKIVINHRFVNPKTLTVTASFNA